jgi:hypothetical protein
MGKMIDQPWFLFGSSESAPETWMVSSDVCHKAENLWAHWSSFLSQSFIFLFLGRVKMHQVFLARKIFSLDLQGHASNE